MRWNVEPKGKGKVLINCIYTQELDTFIQCLKDEDRRQTK